MHMQSVQTAGNPFTYGLNSQRQNPPGLKLPSIGKALDQKSVDTLQKSNGNHYHHGSGHGAPGSVFMSSLD